MELHINSELILNQLTENDILTIASYLNDKDIYDRTLRLPYPYKVEDAERFIASALKFEEENKIRRNWAIRHEEHGLIGSIGLLFLDGIDSHKNEFGYWIGKPFWNKGYMTDIVRIFTEYCLKEFKYKRFEASVDPANPASAKVLLKNGFVYEGTLKNYNLKAGKLLDVEMYARYQS